LCQQAFTCRTGALAPVEQWHLCLKYPFTNEKGDQEHINNPFAPIIKSAVTYYTRRWKSAMKPPNNWPLFILAPNDIDGSQSMGDILRPYKSQQAVQKGCRFLKSPEGIKALLMVMVMT